MSKKYTIIHSTYRVDLLCFFLKEEVRQEKNNEQLTPQSKRLDALVFVQHA